MKEEPAKTEPTKRWDIDRLRGMGATDPLLPYCKHCRGHVAFQVSRPNRKLTLINCNKCGREMVYPYDYVNELNREHEQRELDELDQKASLSDETMICAIIVMLLLVGWFFWKMASMAGFL